VGILACWIFLRWLRTGRRQISWEKLPRRAGSPAFGAVFNGGVLLVNSCLRTIFHRSYIFHHSNRNLPLPYNLPALVGTRGVRLCFGRCCCPPTAGAAIGATRPTHALFAHPSVVIAPFRFSFCWLLNFAARPFAIMQGTLPADGNGLNPLLQLCRDV